MNGRRPAFTSWFTRDRETPRILAASRFVANQGCPGVYRCRARVSTSVSSRPRRCLLIALGSSPLETQRSTVLARTPRMRAASAELSPWQGPGRVLVHDRQRRTVDELAPSRTHELWKTPGGP